MLHVSHSPLSSWPLDEIKSAKYELPDGQIIDLGGERCKFTEVMFTGSFDLGEKTNDFVQNKTGGFTGCSNAINMSISNTEIDIRKELYQNILITGKNLALPGFVLRLQNAMNETAPQTIMKMKVSQCGNALNVE